MGVPGVTPDLFFEVLEKLKYKELLIKRCENYDIESLLV